MILTRRTFRFLCVHRWQFAEYVLLTRRMSPVCTSLPTL
jgi:hypothetical protein